MFSPHFWKHCCFLVNCSCFTTPCPGKHTHACHAHIWSVYEVLIQVGFYSLTLPLYFIYKSAWSDKILPALDKLEEWKIFSDCFRINSQKKRNKKLTFKRKTQCSPKMITQNLLAFLTVKWFVVISNQITFAASLFIGVCTLHCPAVFHHQQIFWALVSEYFFSMQEEELPIASASYSTQGRKAGGKPEGRIWLLCGRAGTFMAGWDGYPSEQKVSLSVSLQS